MPTTLQWNKSTFSRLIIISLMLNILWALIATQISVLLLKDTGNLITCTGFPVIYSLTFFSSFDDVKKTAKNFSTLTITLLVIFLIATIAVPMLSSSLPFNENGYLLLFCSSFTAITAIIFVLAHYTSVYKKWLAIFAATLVAFLITFLFFSQKELPDYRFTSFAKIINPLGLGFCLWQLSTTFVISPFLSYRKPAPTVNNDL